MKYYHATSLDAWKGIETDQLLKTGCDGVVYLAETAQNAIQFVTLRLLNEPIIVIEVEVPDDKMSHIEESFDHSYAFFQCRAWTYDENIPYSWVTSALMYA